MFIQSKYKCMSFFFICLFYVICLIIVLFAHSCTTYKFYIPVAETEKIIVTFFPGVKTAKFFSFQNNKRIGFSNWINKCKESRGQD